MTVYVDDARIPWRGYLWSHLVADTAEELHLAAEALGLARHRAQENGRTLHYDLPEDLRKRAVELGIAEHLHWRDLVRRRGSMAGGRRARRVSERVSSTDKPRAAEP